MREVSYMNKELDLQGKVDTMARSIQEYQKKNEELVSKNVVLEKEKPLGPAEKGAFFSLFPVGNIIDKGIDKRDLSCQVHVNVGADAEPQVFSPHPTVSCLRLPT